MGLLTAATLLSLSPQQHDHNADHRTHRDQQAQQAGDDDNQPHGQPLRASKPNGTLSFQSGRARDDRDIHSSHPAFNPARRLEQRRQGRFVINPLHAD